MSSVVSIRPWFISILSAACLVAGCDQHRGATPGDPTKILRAADLAVDGGWPGAKVTPVAWSNTKVAEESQRVEDDFYRMSVALRSGDTDTSVRLLAPLAVEGMGGVEKAKATYARSREDMQSKGIEMSPWELSAPTFVEGPNFEFVLVPTKSVMKRDGKSFDSFTTQLGFRKRGETQWRYVDGSRMRRQMKHFIPEFPADYPIPEPKQVPSK